MKKNLKSLSLVLCCILILTSLCSCSRKKDEPVNNDTDIIEDIPTEAQSVEEIKSEAETTTQSDETTTKQPETTTAASQPTTNAPASNIVQMSADKAVSLYNGSINRVKSDAKKITRNYEHLSSDDKYFQMPSSIQGLAKTAMGMFIKGSDNAEVWTSKEDFKIGFPVGNEDYSSHLKASKVKSVTCKDNGNTYEIDMVLYDDAITSPAKGEGYAGVFNTVTAETITGVNVPGVTFEKVNVNGINGEIKFTLDKSTNRITEVVMINTDVLDMRVKVLVGSLDAKFALACDRSYSIEY